MYKYILKRLLMMIPVIIGISFIIFSIMSLTPGTPGDVILGNMGTPEAIQEMNEKLGFYDPFLIRYGNYMKDVITGDFGNSYRTGLPVVEEIAARFPVTIKLALFSTILAVIIGIPLGILSAVKQYSLIDNVSTVCALAFMSMPQFWLGLLLILLFSLKLTIPYIRFRFTASFCFTCFYGLCGTPGYFNTDDPFYDAGSYQAGLCKNSICKRSSEKESDI